jgi:sulfatase modifying factor 1
VKLNIKSRRHYRLPTEAEWEFAARSGGKKEKYTGIGTEENLGDYAIFDVNAEASTRPVGTKKPNALGIHDMSGNVWEWCQDWYDEDYYRKSPKHNPTGSNDKREYRVLRGGAWNYPANQLRAANRSRSKPSDRFQDGNGFRLVLPIQ